MSTPDAYFNPLAPEIIADNLRKALELRPHEQLPLTTRFPGGGVYALYYTGNFAPYAPISNPGCAVPIYVGKATPTATRTGRFSFEEGEEAALFGRLTNHSKSIQQVEAHAQTTGVAPRLRLADFRCRYLVLDPIWVALAEAVLISRYQPLWNQNLAGFGNNPQGGTRVAGARSAWDALHCRSWANLQQPNPKTEAALIAQVEAHLAAHHRAQEGTLDPGAAQVVTEALETLVEEPGGLGRG